MLILAVDTSTRHGSLALRRGGALLREVRRDLEGGHSTWLVGQIEEMLVSQQLVVGDLEGLAVVTGPGSFTGLRVGLATVQGLALAGGIPCLGVSTLDVLAWKARGSGPRIAAVMDAWRGEVFVGEYDDQGTPQAPPAILTPEALEARLAGEAWALFGDGAQRYRERLAAACPGAAFPDRSLFLAAALAELAEARLARGEGGPGADLRATYLRPPALKSTKR